MKLAIVKEFKVAIKSLNTNSFGLHSMMLMAKDGSAYNTHASMYNAAEEGETVLQVVQLDEEGNPKGTPFFRGHEMTTLIPRIAPKELIDDVWGS